MSTTLPPVPTDGVVGDSSSDGSEIVEHPLAPRPVKGWQLDPNCPLHQLFLKRMESERDLKIIITARDAQTGVGKSTLNFGLAASWNPIYTDEEWTAEEYATYDVAEYLQKYVSIPNGSVLAMEEAEQLDSRRGMSNNNVDFSHYWMAMRVRQVVSILTLPTTAALDKRLWMLADVWIDVACRGRAVVHRIGVNSYTGEMYRKKVHEIEWPDLSTHPEMKKLDRMKEEKIDRGLSDMQEEEEVVDPKEVKREEKVTIAQRLRDHTDLTGKEIGEVVGRSHTWVYNHTESDDE